VTILFFLIAIPAYSSGVTGTYDCAATPPRYR